jgi:hypothetical protein
MYVVMFWSKSPTESHVHWYDEQQQEIYVYVSNLTNILIITSIQAYTAHYVPVLKALLRHDAHCVALRNVECSS